MSAAPLDCAGWGFGSSMVWGEGVEAAGPGAVDPVLVAGAAAGTVDGRKMFIGWGRVVAAGVVVVVPPAPLELPPNHHGLPPELAGNPPPPPPLPLPVVLAGVVVAALVEEEVELERSLYHL